MLNHNDQPSYSMIQQVQDDDDQPDGRSYECTYCKHGFTNAQALGGHMNVHRKERAKNRFDPTNNKSHVVGDHKQERKTREFMLRSSPMMFDHDKIYQNPNGSMITGTPSGEDVRLSLNLSLQFDRSYEEVDLELRLG